MNMTIFFILDEQQEGQVTSDIISNLIFLQRYKKITNNIT